MRLSDQSEEILETLWVKLVENKHRWVDTEICGNNDVLLELQANECVDRKKNRLTLTETGTEEARGCIRRHRLAERLLNDVLRMKEGVIHEASCDFEHALHRGVDANVCTLLGHPRYCPHGSPIPEGQCCKEQHEHPEQLVKPLATLRKKRTGIVAYLHTDDQQAMQKLIAMGVLPGTAVEVIQTFPTIAFQAGRSQFAIDKELAEKIMVRQNVKK